MLLHNLVRHAAPDATTVVFTLKAANDQIWPQILFSTAAPIVDEQMFSADRVMSDDDLRKDSAVKATNGPGGEIRCIVFNFDTQPFGAKAGGPDGAKARSTLTSAGITARVVLSLQYDTDHYGASSSAEYALVTSQLEQVAVSGKKVSGVTREGSFEFRFGTLSNFCEKEHEPAP